MGRTVASGRDQSAQASALGVPLRAAHPGDRRGVETGLARWTKARRLEPSPAAFPPGRPLPQVTAGAVPPSMSPRSPPWAWLVSRRGDGSLSRRSCCASAARLEDRRLSAQASGHTPPAQVPSIREINWSVTPQARCRAVPGLRGHLLPSSDATPVYDPGLIPSRPDACHHDEYYTKTTRRPWPSTPTVPALNLIHRAAACLLRVMINALGQ